jgi:hypothetical protein
MTALAAQLRALGLEASGPIAESAVVTNGRFDPAATLARLRARLAFYERELEGMQGFASKWSAPMSDVTDLHDDYQNTATQLRAAIAALASRVEIR